MPVDPWAGYYGGLRSLENTIGTLEESHRQKRREAIEEPYLRTRNETAALALEEARDKATRTSAYRQGLSALEGGFESATVPTPLPAYEPGQGMPPYRPGAMTERPLTDQEKNQQRLTLAFKHGMTDEISKIGSFIDVTNKLNVQDADTLTKWATSVSAFRKQFGAEAAKEYGLRLAARMGIPREQVAGIDFTPTGEVFKQAPNGNWYVIGEDGKIHEFKPNVDEAAARAHDTVLEKSADGTMERRMQWNPSTRRYDIVVSGWSKIAKTVEGAAAERTAEQTVFRNERDMRDRFEKLPEVKDYGVMTTHFGRLKEAWEEVQKTGNKNAADQALINVFNKMMDPSSVVRESEFARTPEYIPWANWLQAKIEKARKGGPGLTDQDRKGIYDMAVRFHDTAVRMYELRAAEYKDLATQYKLNPDRVVFRKEVKGSKDDADEILRKIKEGKM